VDVDGLIEGPISSQMRSIQYNIAETDATTRLVAEKTGLSTAYVTKIRAMIRMVARTRFDVDEFAAGLDISPRSARRILQNIAEAGHADIVALESRSRTGRPRRVYELKL
jgi:predicted ArsR family transcriptional regulator